MLLFGVFIADTEEAFKKVLEGGLLNEKKFVLNVAKSKVFVFWRKHSRKKERGSGEKKVIMKSRSIKT